MFASKISILSLFVFCLFTLGQAAPTLDSESSLVTRGLFSKKHKTDDPLVKHVAEVAECKTLNILLHLKEKYILAEKDMTAEETTNKSSKQAVKEAKKEAKKFGGLAKKLGKQIKASEKALKKMGISDAESHCKSVAKASSPQTTATSSVHATSTPTPTSHAN